MPSGVANRMGGHEGRGGQVPAMFAWHMSKEVGRGKREEWYRKSEASVLLARTHYSRASPVRFLFQGVNTAIPRVRRVRRQRSTCQREVALWCCCACGGRGGRGAKWGVLCVRRGSWVVGRGSCVLYCTTGSSLLHCSIAPSSDCPPEAGSTECVFCHCVLVHVRRG
jgi:hypothetical protein